MVTHILERCAIKALGDVWTRTRKVFFTSADLPKVYIPASVVAYWLRCVAMASIPWAGEHPFLSAPLGGASVYYARAVPKGEDVSFKTKIGLINGAAYAALKGTLPMRVESILIETGEAAGLSMINGKSFTLKFDATLAGLEVGLEIFVFSNVANAINAHLFDESVTEPKEPAFNASNVDMCMWEADEEAIISVRNEEFFIHFGTYTLPDIEVGTEIFVFSNVANAINDYLFDESVTESIGPAFNASNVDMCMGGSGAR
jgi:hypothetical protein